MFKFVLIFAFGHEREPPEGAIDMLEISARYRDHSVLCGPAGAILTRWPRAGRRNPLSLTNGSRGYDEDLWTSEPSPQYPIEFEWSLANPVKLERMQINQHPYWPAKYVEVDGQDDKGAWNTLWSLELDNCGVETSQPPYAYTEIDDTAPVVALRLTIFSGHNTERCGLDGIEVYGEGAVFTGDGKACTISEEVAGINSGDDIYARLVLSDGEITTCGKVVTTTMPATRAPQLVQATFLRRENNPDCIVVRGNAMGLETELAAELQLSSSQIVTISNLYFGCQPTSRHIYVNLPETLPVEPGVVRITARNIEGESTVEIPWPPM